MRDRRINPNNIEDIFELFGEIFNPLLNEGGNNNRKKDFEKSKKVLCNVNGLVNVVEDENEVVIMMTAMGFDKNNLEIEAMELDDGGIGIRIKSKDQLSEYQKEILELEKKSSVLDFLLGGFKIDETIALSEGYDINKIKVKFFNGLLIIRVGKKEKVKATKKIIIE